MTVQLLVFEGCPLAEPARKNLRQALAACNLTEFAEIDILDPDSPEELQGWGSPTILVNGADISGHPKGDCVSCRVYDTPDGAPDVQAIINELRKVD